LLTGASGLVGRAIRQRWEREGLEAAYLGRAQRAGWWCADLLDPASLRALPWERLHGVVHGASRLPWDAGDVAGDNVAMTRNLLAALERAPLRHFVHLSSVSVYPLPSQGRIVLEEAGPPEPPSAPYGASKWEQERLVEAAARARGWKACILRLSSVYGPGQGEHGALPVFWARARRGEELVVSAPRGYVQNYVAADDVAEVLWRAQARGLAGRFNVFSDATVDMWTLAQAVRRAAGGGRLVDRRSDQPCPEVVYSRAALDRALGHRFLDLAAGLERLR
jgi:nucleoside-diphosphate-sugar epimerase